MTNMRSLEKSAIKGVVWSIFDKVINQLGSFALLVYLSRILSPSDFGLIAMLSIFLAIAQSLIDSGLSQGLIQKSHKVTEDDLSTVFYTNLFISILLYAILFIIAPFIADFYNQPELVDLARVLFAIIIINSFIIVPKAILTIDIDFKTQGIINSISTLTSSCVALYMVMNNYGYWALVGMNISKSLSNAILFLFFTKWIPRLVFSLDSFKGLFLFGSKLLIAGLVSTTIQNLYTVLIGRYFSAVQVGYYQQGYNYTNMISGTISSVVQGVTYPLMTSIQRDTKRLVDIYVKVMGIVTLITFPVFFGFIAISEEFVLIFLGDDWVSIIPVLMILSCARIITPISSLNLNILNAKGRSDLFLKTDLSKLPMTIITLIIALPYGIIGIAIGQVVTTFISFFINAYYPGKLFGFGWFEQVKLLMPTLLASLVMYVGIMFITFDDLLTQMLVKMILGAVIYICSCWVLKVPSYIYVSNIIIKRLSVSKR